MRPIAGTNAGTIMLPRRARAGGGATPWTAETVAQPAPRSPWRNLPARRRRAAKV